MEKIGNYYQSSLYDRTAKTGKESRTATASGAKSEKAGKESKAPALSKAAQKLLKEIDEGRAYYHLIEVMTCQGGCVGGAGQPHALLTRKQRRADGLYEVDRTAPFKRAERNPSVLNILEKLGQEERHELLHVNYVKE